MLFGGFSIKIGIFSFFIEVMRVRRIDKGDLNVIINIVNEYENE